MRLSRYFLPVLKDAPSDASIASHKLMIRSGMIRQNGAGIYTWLPLGYKVLQKVEQIVREEMDRAGAIEMLMPTIQQADLWHETGRYDDYGPEMLRITDRQGRDMLYGPTNEDMITDAIRAYVKSYRQLPVNLYHIQWKFRDEIRPRFGVMRGREFLMKDAYSFDLDEQGARVSYQKMFCAYLNAFDRMGLKAIPMQADTGPIGGELSHEFIIFADTGESEVFCDRDLLDIPVPGIDLDFESDLSEEMTKRTKYYAATEEKHNAEAFAEIPSERQVKGRGIEVGHIFYFGTKYSEPMNAVVQTEDSGTVAVHGGSYGIGISRLVGAIIEASHDEFGIVWPKSVSPFDVGIINLKSGDTKTDEVSSKIYDELREKGLDVLYDDTTDRAGVKFNRMDLVGLPWQIVVGPRGVEAGTVELKNRSSNEKAELSVSDALEKIMQA